MLDELLFTPGCLALRSFPLLLSCFSFRTFLLRSACFLETLNGWWLHFQLVIRFYNGIYWFRVCILVFYCRRPDLIDDDVMFECDLFCFLISLYYHYYCYLVRNYSFCMYLLVVVVMIELFRTLCVLLPTDSNCSLLFLSPSLAAALVVTTAALIECFLLQFFLFSFFLSADTNNNSLDSFSFMHSNLCIRCIAFFYYNCRCMLCIQFSQ